MLSREDARIFVASCGTVKRLEKALDAFVDLCRDEATANSILVAGFFDPAPPRPTRTIPAIAFFACLVNRFGTSSDAWPAHVLALILDHMSKYRSRTRVLLYLFLTLDGECFSLDMVVWTMRNCFAKDATRFSIAGDSRIAKYLPNDPPDHFWYPDDILDRIPDEAFSSSDAVTRILNAHRRRTTSISERCIRIIVAKTPENVLLTRVRNASFTSTATLLENLWLVNDAVLSMVPESLRGRVPICAVTIDCLRSQSQWQDGGVPLDTEAAQRLADLASPDARCEAQAYLLEHLAKSRDAIVPLQAKWDRLYPGQTVENHTCPPPWAGHTCDFGERTDTCAECCMNCEYGHLCTRYDLSEAQWQISSTEELLTYFCVPTTAKSAFAAQ